MELNQIKKALYRQNPIANLWGVSISANHYQTYIKDAQGNNYKIKFRIPEEEITPIFKDDNGNYLPQMEAKHLIRWIKNQ